MKIAYVTNIAPHYRKNLWRLLASDNDLDFHFFFGDTQSIRELDFEEDAPVWSGRIHRCKNFRFENVVIFQKGVLNKLRQQKWDAVLLLGDMYILTNWIIARWCKRKGIPLFFWGHGLYGNESGLRLKFRLRFLSMANGHFLYGHYAAKLMVDHGFERSSLAVVYNSLAYDVQLGLRHAVVDNSFFVNRNYFRRNNLPVLVFIGRLTPEKKLRSLIEAVRDLEAKKVYVNVMIIGEGPEEVMLKKSAATLQVSEFIFYGSCYDEREAGALIANSDLCVSPGNVGLTAIHCLSFGTPVCTHGDMTTQMPEAEAIVEGITGIFFDRRSGNLSTAIDKWLKENKDREKVRQACYHIVDKKYNPHSQLAVFKKVLFTKNLQND